LTAAPYLAGSQKWPLLKLLYEFILSRLRVRLATAYYHFTGDGTTPRRTMAVSLYGRYREYAHATLTSKYRRHTLIYAIFDGREVLIRYIRVLIYCYAFDATISG
jgi:hypothetical protein